MVLNLRSKDMPDRRIEVFICGLDEEEKEELREEIGMTIRRRNRKYRHLGLDEKKISYHITFCN